MKMKAKAQFLSRPIGLFILLSITSTQVVHALAFRTDILDGEQNYIDLAKPYNSVARATGNGYIGTGFLASPTKFITAGHLVDLDQDGVVESSTYTARFSTTGSGFDNTFTASSVDVHPLYSSSSRYDIAVFTFSTPIAGYTPMTISTADPLGQLGTMVGYGLHGDGATFGTTSSVDSVRRAAENIIDTQDSRFYLTDFDKASEDTSTYGTATPLLLEGTSARGDSGGPLIVDGAVIGIVQGGYSNPYGEISEYGDRATWVKLNDPDIIAFLEDDHGITVVPEPSVFALAWISLFYLGTRRRLPRERADME
ncbi:MAG TPA: trypsin-like serine protease, partial [Opitutales bacterium]|nr:trypsin-like serine protease [Opitutales bacterium]